MKKIIILIFFVFCIQAYSSDWKYLNRPNLDGQSSFSGMVALDSNQLYLFVGELVTPQLYLSLDKGSNWELLYTYNAMFESPSLSVPINLQVSDSNNIILAYSDIAFKKSTDGGKSFEIIKISDSIDRIQNLIMYNKDIGFLKVRETAYVTYDGWKSYKTSESDFLNRVVIFADKYLDSSNILATRVEIVGDTRRMKLIKINFDDFTIEDIYNFEFEKTGLNTRFFNLEIINENLAFFLADRLNGNGDQSVDVIYKGTKNLRKWEKVLDVENHPIFGITQIAFYDEYNGFATGRGKIYMTNDGGKTWHYDWPIDIYLGNESNYGPSYQYAIWLGQTPIFITSSTRVYRYEGDFFKFGQPPMVYSPNITNPTECYIENLSSNEEIKWEKSSGAEFYNIEFASDSTFKDILKREENVERESYSLATLEPGLHYYYRVQSANANRESEWTEPCSFSLELDQAENLKPQCGDTVISKGILLEWGEVKNAEEYYIDLAIDPDMLELVKKDTVSDTYLLLDSLEIDTEYFWRVSSYNKTSKARSEYSDICSFNTKDISSVISNGINRNNKLYPNPTYDYLYIDDSELSLSSGDYVIRDINGKEILGGSLSSTNGRYKVSVESLTPGVYIIELNNYRERFIKH